MSEKLKPCPKCGENVEMVFSLNESNHPHDDDYLEARPSCGCRLFFKASAGYYDEEERENARLSIIEDWNELCREAEGTLKLMTELESILSDLEAKAKEATLEEWREGVAILPDGSFAAAVVTVGGDEICNTGQSLVRDVFDAAFIAAANPAAILRLVGMVRWLASTHHNPPYWIKNAYRALEAHHD